MELTVALVAGWSPFFLWINSRLKIVSVDESDFHVSRLFGEKIIPLSEIADARLTTIEFTWVGVYFTSRWQMGSKTFFMPTIVRSVVFSFQRFHPVVDKLKTLVKARKDSKGAIKCRYYKCL